MGANALRQNADAVGEARHGSDHGQSDTGGEVVRIRVTVQDDREAVGGRDQLWTGVPPVAADGLKADRLLSDTRIRGNCLYLLEVHPQGWQRCAGEGLRVRILAGGGFRLEQGDGPVMVFDLRLDI